MVAAESALVFAAIGAGKWLLRALAQADDGSEPWENAQKILGSTILAVLQTPVSSTIWGARDARGLTASADHLNNHIEQAYCLAELNALVVFLSRLRDAGHFVGPGWLDSMGPETIDRLTEHYRVVRRDRRTAYVADLQLDDIAITLTSFSAEQWRDADTRAQALRQRVERRALEQLHIAAKADLSDDFVRAFQDGIGQVPPWFGILAHCFVEVLLNQQSGHARESVTLRLLARSALRSDSPSDLARVEQALRAELRDHWPSADLATKLQELFVGYGTALGSSLDDVSAGIARLEGQLGAFRDEVFDSLAGLAALLGAQSARLDEVDRQTLSIYEGVQELLLRVRGADEPASNVLERARLEAAIARAGLPRLPVATAPPFGLSAELDRMEAFLDSPKRLLLVNGRSGSGKTLLVSYAIPRSQRARAAREVAIYVRASKDQLLLGPSFLDALERLASNLDDSFTPPAPSEALQYRLERLDTVLRRSDVTALLVADSVEWCRRLANERLADEVLEQIIMGCTGSLSALRVVVVSTIPLDWIVRHADAHDEQGLSDQIELPPGFRSEDDSLALLARHAPRVRTDGASVEALRRLCRSVGDNPIAIRQIARVLHANPLVDPERLLVELTRSTSGPAVDLVRKAVFERLYEPLRESTRRVLRAVALLRSDATAESIAFVTSHTQAEVEAELSDLVQSGLVLHENGKMVVHDSESAFYVSTFERGELLSWCGRATEYWLARDRVPWTRSADSEPLMNALNACLIAGDLGRSAELRRIAGHRFFDSGYFLSALAVLNVELAGASSPEQELDARILRARCLWRKGAYAEASSAAKGAIEMAASLGQDPCSPQLRAARMLSAASSLEIGFAQRAIAEYQQLSAELKAARPGAGHPELASSYADALGGLAYALSIAGDQRGALEAAQAALDACGIREATMPTSDPRAEKMIVAFARVGLFHSYIGSFVEARAAYLAATRLADQLQSKRGQVLAHGHFAELELIEGNTELALEMAKRSLEAESDSDASTGNWSNWLIAMALAVDDVDLANAERFAAEAGKFRGSLNESNARVLLGILLLRRGQSYAALEELKGAIAMADKLIEACPTNWEALIARGLARLGLQSLKHSTLEEALGDYARAFEASPYAGHGARVRVQLKIAGPALTAEARAQADLICRRYDARSYVRA